MAAHLVVACCRQMFSVGAVLSVLCDCIRHLITAKYIGPTRISPVGPGVFGLLKTMYLAV